MLIRLDRQKVEEDIEQKTADIRLLSNRMRKLLDEDKISESSDVLFEMLRLQGERNCLRRIAFMNKYKGRCENCQE